MKITFQELDRRLLPLFYKVKVANGKFELFILKATRHGIQLIKADSIMLQLLAQN